MAARVARNSWVYCCSEAAWAQSQFRTYWAASFSSPVPPLGVHSDVPVLAASKASAVWLAPVARCGSGAAVPPPALAHCRLHLEAGSCFRLTPGQLLWRRSRLAALARSGWRCRRRPLHEDHGLLPPLHHWRFLIDLLQRRHRNVGGHDAEGNG